MDRGIWKFVHMYTSSTAHTHTTLMRGTSLADHHPCLNQATLFWEGEKIKSEGGGAGSIGM